LTRIQPCGLDFTARTNHLAHHLVFLPDELAQLPSPAAILRHWPGWLSSWQGEPRLLEAIAPADFASAEKSFLPAQTWLRMTGDAGRAAGLLETECIRGCYLLCPPGGEGPVLEMFCETLQLLNPNGQYPLRPWRHPFTTFLQAEDNPADFQWRACQEGTPAWQQAVQRSTPLLPLASVRIPGNSLVNVAREGLKPPEPPQPALSLRGLPASRTPPPQRLIRPSPQPEASRRSSGLSLIRAYAAMRLRLSMLRQWFSNRSRTSRAGMGIFAAVLLGLMVMKYWGAPQHPAPRVAPPAPPARAPSAPPSPAPAPSAPPSPARTPAVPAPRAGNPEAPPAEQAVSPRPVSAQAEPLNPRQLDWLSADGQTYVVTTPNIAHFDLPIAQVSPLESLIARFDKILTLPTNILLTVKTNTWDSEPGARMFVNGRSAQVLSAQTASGLGCSFDYSDFLSKTSPVVVTTTFATPPGAFSVQFRFSSPANGEPFRLLIVNETNPPPPVRLSLRWLKINRASRADPLLQEPWREILGKGRFTFLQGQEWQLRPFIQVGQQPRYLYENWPAADLPPKGQELNFAWVTNRLARPEYPSEVDAKLKLERKLYDLANVVDYPLGRDLGLLDPLTSFSIWTNTVARTNVPPLPALFLIYLGELQKEGAAITNNDWVTNWPSFTSYDSSNQLNKNFQSLNFWWTNNVPAAIRSPEFQVTNSFKETNYFSATWQRFNELENLRRQEWFLQFNSAQERRKRVPGTLDDAAYVGLFITDPKQPRRGLEIIRFQGP